MKPGETILIVDAAETSRKDLAHAFQDRYAILEAGTEAEALALLRRDPSAISVVLLALGSPQLSGFELLRRIKEDPATTDIPVIVNTVHGDDRSEIAALKLGADDFIFRPYHPELILHRVSHAITQKRNLQAQKRLQRQLEKTTREMQMIVDNIPGGVVKIILKDNKIVPTYVSEGWCRMVGDTKENILRLYGDNAMNGVHPADYVRVADVFTRAMQTGQPIDSIYRVANSNGEYRWVNNRSRLVSDENGQLNYFAIYTDVTDAMETKEKYKKANEERELLYNSIPGAVFKCRFNADWDVIFANDGLFRFLGYTREEFARLFHNKMSGVIHPEDGAVMVSRISAQLERGTTVQNENRLICKDGTVKWISIHAELLEDEASEKYFYCTFVEITEQKKAELALSRAQEKLSAAIAHAGLAYWEYDIRNHKAYLNQVSVSEYALDAVLDNYPQCMYTSGTIARESISQYQQLIDAVQAGVPSVTADIKTVDFRGTIAWKRMRFTTLFDEQGKPFWAVATAETIDEYKALEQQFAITAAQTGIETWIYDIQSKTIHRTATTGQDYGVQAVVKNVPDSLLQMGAIHPDDAAATYEMYEKIRRGEKTASAKVRMFLPGMGEYAYHQINYTVLFDKSGTPVKAVGTGIDISQQVNLENQYREALEVYHNVPKEDVLLVGYCNITQNKLMSMTSRDNVNYAEAQRDDRDAFFIGLSKIVPDAEQQQEILDKFLSEPLRRAYAKGITRQSVRCKLLVHDTYYKYVELTIDVRKRPGTEELTGFFSMTDITEKTIYKKAVDTGFETYCDWLVDVDVNRDVYTMLTMRQGLVNVPPSTGVFSKINENYARTLADEESITACAEKLSYPYIRQQLEAADDYWFYYRTCETGELRTKKIQVFYIDKEFGHVGFIRTDVTETLADEQKKNEALAHALTSSERANKAKTDFLSRMSHDIRTPMNAIIGMTQLAKQQLDDKDKVLESLTVIDSSSKLLLRIMNDVLDMSQIESGCLTLVQEPFDCFTECGNVIEITAVMLQEKHQHLKVFKDVSHRYFIGDTVRLKRVVINLLNNASKFSPQGGEIQLSILEEKNLNPQLATLVFSVKDSGIGIPKDKLETIFLPFEQLDTDAKHEGTGLGLPIVKSIVETKGGTITVDSALGKGSTFTVRLPMRIAEATPQEPRQTTAAAEPEPIDFSNLRVLLVEDHPVNTLVAKRLLEQFGAWVDTAKNGAVGYDKLTQSKSGTYNLIFMDIQMPVLNGYEATRAIRSSGHPQAKSIPIIAMTANAFAEDIQKSLDSGMNGHLAKPITPDLIAKAIRDLCPVPPQGT